MDRFVLVRLDKALRIKDALLSVLSGPRKEKAMRYVQEADQVRSALGTLLIGAYAGKGELSYNEYGKPYLPEGPYFSISHGGSFICIYVSDEEVGVDVESVDRCEVKLAKAAMTTEEAKEIHDKRSMALAWTRKEAIAKCLGTGIEKPRTYGVAQVGVNQYTYRGETYFTKSIELDRHVLCLCNKSGRGFPPLEKVTVEALLRLYLGE